MCLFLFIFICPFFLSSSVILFLFFLLTHRTLHSYAGSVSFLHLKRPCNVTARPFAQNTAGSLLYSCRNKIHSVTSFLFSTHSVVVTCVLYGLARFFFLFFFVYSFIHLATASLFSFVLILVVNRRVEQISLWSILK